MISRSNLRIGEISLAPKTVIMIYPSINHDNTTNPLYTSEQDRPENKATIRTIQKHLALNVIEEEDEEEKTVTHDDNFLTLQC